MRLHAAVGLMWPSPALGEPRSESDTLYASSTYMAVDARSPRAESRSRVRIGQNSESKKLSKNTRKGALIIS